MRTCEHWFSKCGGVGHVILDRATQWHLSSVLRTDKHSTLSPLTIGDKRHIKIHNTNILQTLTTSKRPT